MAMLLLILLAALIGAAARFKGRPRVAAMQLMAELTLGLTVGGLAAAMLGVR